RLRRLAARAAGRDPPSGSARTLRPHPRAPHWSSRAPGDHYMTAASPDRCSRRATFDRFGGEGGMRTLDGGLTPPYSLSRAAPSAARPPLRALLPGWVRSLRRVTDSTPRTGRPVYGFQDRRLRPLGQPSGQPPGCRAPSTVRAPACVAANPSIWAGGGPSQREPTAHSAPPRGRRALTGLLLRHRAQPLRRLVGGPARLARQAAQRRELVRAEVGPVDDGPEHPHHAGGAPLVGVPDAQQGALELRVEALELVAARRRLPRPAAAPHRGEAGRRLRRLRSREPGQPGLVGHDEHGLRQVQG